MKAVVDTQFWKKLLDLPGTETAVWIIPDESQWSITELRDLLDSPPAGTCIYLWEFSPLPVVCTPIRMRKRSFFHTKKIWARIACSRDTDFNGLPLWFDLASLDGACAEDLSTYLTHGTLGISAGILVSDANSCEDTAAVILSTLLHAWNQQLSVDHPHEWTERTQREVHQSLPGMVDLALDSNGRPFLLASSSPATDWLLRWSSTEIDPNMVFSCGVSIREPAGPVHAPSYWHLH